MTSTLFRPTPPVRLEEVESEAATEMGETVVAAETAETAETSETAETCIAALERMESVHTCVICMEGERDVIFRPCGHGCCCVGCGVQVDKCPLCRTAVSTRLQITEVLPDGCVRVSRLHRTNTRGAQT